MSDDDTKDLERQLLAQLRDPERAQAVAELERALERQQPAEKFDFTALIPDQELSADNSEWDQQQARKQRYSRLRASGILSALKEEYSDWLVRGAPIPTPAELDAMSEAERATAPRDTPATKAVKRWLHARSTRSSAFSVLVMLGARGQGKSVGAGLLISIKGPAVYCTAEELRASFVATHFNERSLYIRAKRTRVLVVDELGRETDAESADAMMFDLVNSRLGRGMGTHELWTMGIGNLSEDAFRGRYDESSVGRIEENGVILTVEGANLRTRLADRLSTKKGGA